ncbi:MarR family transcriptional regulator [uncultured Rhodoblastus sp.]|uniref:MarR family winged helix-turn-helix transcriptional regulator n=1 Tax=uncultured Rhodoblastus sp. TaxID=543037 RepID=UPI0025CC37B7|nr:MarR family transcriptional regulator [uncultured Rhodoblastus sp.]
MSNPVSLDVVHEVRDACLCLATQRAARTLARRFDRAFQPLGLTNGQFSLMMPLNVPEPMKLGRLAALLAMDRTTLTAALKSLERRGLVEVSPDKDDHRARRLSLTQAGRETLVAAIPIWRAEHAALEAELSKPNADRLRELLPFIRPAKRGGGED